MTIAALIKKGGLREIATANPAKAANDERRDAGTLAGLATLALAEPPKAGVELLSLANTEGERKALEERAAILEFEAELAREETERQVRYQRVESMLEKDSGLRYVLISDADAEGHDVILTLGIRDLGTCELAISKAEYDAFKVLRVIEKATVGPA